MKFHFLIVLLAALCASCAERAVSSRTNPPIVESISKEKRISEINSSVFCLSVVVPNSRFPVRRAIGTGFLVSENLLATAFHVKDDLEQSVSNFRLQKAQIIAWKKFGSGEQVQIPLKLMTADKNSDLALYSFDTEIYKQQMKTAEIKFLPLAERLPEIGENILSIGYYGTMDFPFNSLGNVSMIDNAEDIYSDMTLMPGNSGSPLVSMETGEVLGVNTKVMTIGDSTLRLGIARRIADLKRLIEKAKN